MDWKRPSLILSRCIFYLFCQTISSYPPPPPQKKELHRQISGTISKTSRIDEGQRCKTSETNSSQIKEEKKPFVINSENGYFISAFIGLLISSKMSQTNTKEKLQFLKLNGFLLMRITSVTLSFQCYKHFWVDPEKWSTFFLEYPLQRCYYKHYHLNGHVKYFYLSQGNITD